MCSCFLIQMIEELGGSLTADGSTSTDVITGKVRKTLNFCIALFSGRVALHTNDDDYISKYRASLKAAGLRAKACPGALFEGYDVCISAHAQPPPKTLSLIVKSAGGNVIHELDKVNNVWKTIFVACEEDVEEALVVVEKGIWTFNVEWLMACIMRQEVDLEAPQFAESL
ncbi:mediator of DNA damage checkpoint protein 1-like [Cucumis sativus]|uniref:mediator of DNA damage checkpoint protein 1-like n=1 Tax=Cucumis sativus TaxID=3659 RepID=UPI0012F499AA|nr:mediator of DNA damage checkpoint protein 1-like [Cucumis sativus]